MLANVRLLKNSLWLIGTELLVLVLVACEIHWSFCVMVRFEDFLGTYTLYDFQALRRRLTAKIILCVCAVILQSAFGEKVRHVVSIVTSRSKRCFWISLCEYSNRQKSP